jgi:hypothetical protein
MPPIAGPPAVIRVASVPAGHVYVRHLADPDRVDGVERLPDVKPEDGTRVPGGWWPPLMLDADWIRDNRDQFDVFHVHFGFDWRSLPELEEALVALDDLGAPLVFTLHDLRNPRVRGLRRRGHGLRPARTAGRRRPGLGRRGVGLPPGPPSPSPPVEHLDDILRNATLFHSRWGWWPMAGWLTEFARAGLVRYERRQDRWVPLNSAT